MTETFFYILYWTKNLFREKIFNTEVQEHLFIHNPIFCKTVHKTYMQISDNEWTSGSIFFFLNPCGFQRTKKKAFFLWWNIYRIQIVDFGYFITLCIDVFETHSLTVFFAKNAGKALHSLFCIDFLSTLYWINYPFFVINMHHRNPEREYLYHLSTLNVQRGVRMCPELSGNKKRIVYFDSTGSEIFFFNFKFKITIFEKIWYRYLSKNK